MKNNSCPKCGIKPKGIIRFAKNTEEPRFKAECYICGLHTEFCRSADEAVTKWNEMTKGEYK